MGYHVSKALPVTQHYVEAFGREPEHVASAPGRIEFIGNHTDYNGGLVLGAAIDRRIWAAIGRRTDRQIHLISTTLGGKLVVDLDNLDRQDEINDWANYPLGVLTMMQREGLKVDVGFNLVVDSTVPLGAGLSSSAALELASAYALAVTYGGDFSKKDLARIGRRAENEFVGMPCGILDQGVSAFAEKDHLVLVNAKDETFDTVPIPAGTRFWIFNSHKKHALVDSLYAARHRECMEARDRLAQYFSIELLADLSPEQVETHKDDLSDVLFRRALHIASEHARVKEMMQQLRAGNLERAGQLLFASHESSRMLFENSTPELDLLVETLKTFPEVYGARLTGGGFGGAVMALTSTRFDRQKAEQVADHYERAFSDRPDILNTETDDGAGILF